MTILFYAAVHYVDAIIVECESFARPDFHRNKPVANGPSQPGRTQRAKEVLWAMNSNAQEIRAGQKYKQLFDWSQDARYEPEMATLLGGGELDKAKEYVELIRIITCIRTTFSPSMDSSGQVAFAICNRRLFKESLP